MRTKIIVTGANGQLGSEIKSLQSKFPFDFIFHDIDTVDITNEEAVKNLFTIEKPNFVINCAAYTAVDKAEQDESSAELINNTAVEILANNCKPYNTNFIHISTDYVFDGFNYRPYKEDDAVNPQSVYGKTKLHGEKAAIRYTNAMVIRTSWLYSSYGNNFVKTMLRLTKEKESLNVIFDQIGTPTYANDLADAILSIIYNISTNQNQFQWGVYHYSNEGVCSWYDFATEINSIAGNNCIINAIETHEYPLPAKRPFYSVLNKHKIKTNYGISIPHWKSSLKKCMDILLNS